MITLRSKLIGSSVLLVFLAVGALLSLSVYGLKGLSAGFLTLSEERTEFVRSQIEGLSKSSIENIRSVYEVEAKKKGQALLLKDAKTLQPMVDDNSFGALRNFIEQTFSGDSDLLSAAFFVLEDQEIQGWQLVNRANPNGFELPITFSFKERAWKAKRKSGKVVTIPDAGVLEAVVKNSSSIQLRKELVSAPGGGEAEITYYDCVIPVFDGKFGAPVSEARKKGVAVGFLRYQISLEAMEAQIRKQNDSNARMISKLDEGNAASQRRTEELGSKKQQEMLVLTFGASGVFVFLSIVASTFSSGRITQPVKGLTRVAQRMAQGDYKQSVDVQSNDEIGILADAFREMSRAIRKRDEDLADINRNLEKTVEERTLQLKVELKNIESLLNNMKQAVFQVEPSRNVVAPASKFAEELFGSGIVGRSVMEVLYSSLDSHSEVYAGVNTALTAVFGEDSMQWDLLEHQLPARIEWSNGTNSKVLKVSYHPIFDDFDCVEKVMFVVSDVTEVEKLEREISMEKAKNGRRNQIIEDLASISPKQVEEYFSGLMRLLQSSWEEVRALESTPDARIPLLRAVHTIKGNSRVFKMSLVASATHEAESEIIRILDDQDSNWGARIEGIEGALSLIEAAALEYASMARIIFRSPVGFEREFLTRFNRDVIEVDSVLGSPGRERPGLESIRSIRRMAKVLGAMQEREIEKNLLDLSAHLVERAA